MLLAALQLLGHRVYVAEAALERVLVEDRGGAGCLVEDVDDLERGVDRKGRGEADRHPLVERDVAAHLDRLGNLLERMEQPEARRGEPRLGLRDVALDDVVVAQRVAGAARYLVA